METKDKKEYLKPIVEVIELQSTSVLLNSPEEEDEPWDTDSSWGTD